MFRGKSLAFAILTVLGTGAIAVIALAAPNALQALGPLFQRGAGKAKYHRRKMMLQAIERLQKRRLVEMYEKNNELFLKVTARGKAYLQKFEFESLSIARSDVWDHRWRMVIFDIPEQRKNARLALQQKLRDLGFYLFQRSVWVFPYPCRDEIDFVRNFCGVSRFVQYVETVDLDDAEARVRKFFSLL